MHTVISFSILHVYCNVGETTRLLLVFIATEKSLFPETKFHQKN